ncbi:hypothetical protein [Peribacillus loiseleuriae]|uniref:hypothetical protein n=1 Tax=Peribacillus loiseleuriae TaxID=1679170 RepID=UPI003D01B1AF
MKEAIDMEAKDSILNEGDWVIFNGRSKFVGFIENVSSGTDQYYIQFVRAMSGEKAKDKKWIDFQHIESYEFSLEEVDLYSMMDFDTEDRQWFDELQDRLPQDLPF